MPKIGPQITHKSTSAPQGLPGAILEPIWTQFGPISGPILAPLAYYFSPSAAYCASFLLSVCLAFLFCALCLALCLLPSCVLRSVAGSGGGACVSLGILGFLGFPLFFSGFLGLPWVSSGSNFAGFLEMFEWFVS